MRHGEGLPPDLIQRYALVRKSSGGFWKGEAKPLRVSDDGSMVVRHVQGTPRTTTDHQAFYAAPGVLATSRQVLKGIGSALSLKSGTETMQSRAPDDRRAPPQTLLKAEVKNRSMPQDKSGYMYKACNVNFQNLLGMLTASSPGQKLELRRNPLVKLQGAFDDRNRRIIVGDDLGEGMKMARMMVTGESTSRQARAAYDALEESVRKAVSAEHGINEHALPDIGEGWGIFQGGQGGPRGGAMGHYAPVVARSGNDRVTLENDVSQGGAASVAGQGDVGRTWYFRMFGTLKETGKGVEDQTFWGEARQFESGDYGDRPFVAAIGSQEHMDLTLTPLEPLLDSYTEALGEDDQATIRVALNVARALEAQGRNDEAAALVTKYKLL